MMSLLFRHRGNPADGRIAHHIEWDGTRDVAPSTRLLSTSMPPLESITDQRTHDAAELIDCRYNDDQRDAS